MGHQYIKQPNGKFAIWSTVIDDFTAINCTMEEIIEIEIEDEVKNLRRRISEKLEKVDKGEPAYYQFTMSWKAALEERDERHGKNREFDDQGNEFSSQKESQ